MSRESDERKFKAAEQFVRGVRLLRREYVSISIDRPTANSIAAIYEVEGGSDEAVEILRELTVPVGELWTDLPGRKASALYFARLAIGGRDPQGGPLTPWGLWEDLTPAEIQRAIPQGMTVQKRNALLEEACDRERINEPEDRFGLLAIIEKEYPLL